MDSQKHTHQFQDICIFFLSDEIKRVPLRIIWQYNGSWKGDIVAEGQKWSNVAVVQGTPGIQVGFQALKMKSSDNFKRFGIITKPLHVLIPDERRRRRKVQPVTLSLQPAVS